ncbi:MAG: DMT family transporter [Clostridiales bacterium]|nr:DMT family transporter [Clostridiales bacterium]
MEVVVIKKNKQLFGSLCLLLAAVIWGLSFVFQHTAGQKIESFTFNGIRCIMGGLVLVPLALIRSRSKKGIKPEKSDKKTLFKAGILCGLVLFVGLNLQQQAFRYSMAGKVGFVTALYMLLVPIFAVFIGKRAGLRVWIAMLMGTFGLYLLCITSSFTIGKGELLALACSVFFALHILIIDHYASTVDNIDMSIVQFLVAGTLSSICMAIFDTPQLSAIKDAMPQVLYTGIMSSGVAFTLQIVGQKHTEPAIASLLLCLESVFSALFGWMILSQKLSSRELTGCAIMFVAILVAQIPINELIKKRTRKAK